MLFGFVTEYNADFCQLTIIIKHMCGLNVSSKTDRCFIR